MLAGGVPQRTLDHPEMVMEFAIEMLASLERFNSAHGRQLQVRIGVNTGSVVAGVIGKKKMAFDLWGGNTTSLLLLLAVLLGKDSHHFILLFPNFQSTIIQYNRLL